MFKNRVKVFFLRRRMPHEQAEGYPANAFKANAGKIATKQASYEIAL